MPTPVPVRRLLALSLLAASLTALLFAVPAARADAAALGKRSLSEGSRGADVRSLQRLLRRAGFAAKIDGVYGAGTRRTVRRLERELGLRVDGVFTRSDLQRVRRALKPAEGTGGFGMADPAETDRRPRAVSSLQAPGAKARLTEDGLAIPPADAPDAVKKIVAAANVIATTPYRYGGGHGKWEDSAYDCSGSVSYALYGARLLKAPMASGGFTSWGEAGAGEWVTVYAKSDHMYMTVAGLRFDTSGRSRAGTRWQREPRSAAGYAVRHPEGL